MPAQQLIILIGTLVACGLCILYLWAFLTGAIAKSNVRITFLSIFIIFLTLLSCAWLSAALGQTDVIIIVAVIVSLFITVAIIIFGLWNLFKRIIANQDIRIVTALIFIILGIVFGFAVVFVNYNNQYGPPRKDTCYYVLACNRSNP